MLIFNDRIVIPATIRKSRKAKVHQSGYIGINRMVSQAKSAIEVTGICNRTFSTHDYPNVTIAKNQPFRSTTSKSYAHNYKQTINQQQSIEHQANEQQQSMKPQLFNQRSMKFFYDKNWKKGDKEVFNEIVQPQNKMCEPAETVNTSEGGPCSCSVCHLSKSHRNIHLDLNFNSQSVVQQNNQFKPNTRLLSVY